MKRISIIIACVMALAGGGCGVSTSSGSGAEEDWAGEMESTIKEWKTKGGDLAQEEIVNAKTATTLEVAYLSYATELTKLEGELVLLDTPEACEPTQKKLVGFVHKLAAITKAMSEQRNQTATEFREIAESQNELVVGFGHLVRKLKDAQQICSE